MEGKNLEELKGFIKEAKEKTFAAGSEPVESSRKNSKDFEYSRDDYRYRDSFFGGVRDIGEEVVWYRDEPIWGMNYRGGMMEGYEDMAKDVFEFLKEALSNLPIDNPYRGPENYEKEDLKYLNEFKGDIEDFTGYEVIKLDGDKIYERIYHGGTLE